MAVVERMQSLFVDSPLFMEPQALYKQRGMKKQKKRKGGGPVKVGQGGTLDPLADGVLGTSIISCASRAHEMRIQWWESGRVPSHWADFSTVQRCVPPCARFARLMSPCHRSTGRLAFWDVKPILTIARVLASEPHLGSTLLGAISRKFSRSSGVPLSRCRQCMSISH